MVAVKTLEPCRLPLLRVIDPSVVVAGGLVIEQQAFSIHEPCGVDVGIPTAERQFMPDEVFAPPCSLCQNQDVLRLRNWQCYFPEVPPELRAVARLARDCLRIFKPKVMASSCSSRLVIFASIHVSIFVMKSFVSCR